MHTEITDIKNKHGWVCFDAECAFCRACVRRFGALLRRHEFDVVPLQTPWVRERLGEAGLLSELRLLAEDGRVLGGADALVAIADRIWWARPICGAARIPVIRAALRGAYRWIARNRACIGGACRCADAREAGVVLKWVPALALPVGAALLRDRLPAWAWMWVMAFALFLGAKWVTVARWLRPGPPSAKRLLAYALLWPGMDASAFCGKRPVPRPAGREWALAGAKTLLGAAVLWLGVPRLGMAHPLLAGWVGMVGIVGMLHFGLFHLLSLLWRALGVDAKPLMHWPGAATSLSRFWGGRWNTGFSDLVHDHAYAPLTRHVGPRRALFLVFLISGVLHEVVISVPARGGYGLPTLYFTLQGWGLLFEHSRLGRRLGLGKGWRGWAFMVLVAGVPACGLFHPVFIHHVILPMLHCLGVN